MSSYLLSQNPSVYISIQSHNLPLGYIHFWNIYKGGKIMSCFTPSSEGTSLIAVNSSNTVLATGDATGHVKLYNISEYCSEGEL